MWSLLWKVELKEFLPYVAISMLLWQLMSGIVSESTGAFTGSAHTLLSQRLACSTMVYAAVYRNLLVFLHNLAIVAIVFVIFLRPVGWSALLALPALVLMSITAVWLGQLLGLVCARFRDMQHVTQAVLQLGFYVTPVIWKPDFLSPELRWLEYINPFAIYLAILRGPILGAALDPLMWTLAVLISFGGLALSLGVIGRYRRRMLFWL
jgi:ABC-type polysaccharide/polyol phosphate export permease